MLQITPSAKKFTYCDLEGAPGVRGPAVVIDVLRAFTTAAWALGAGAKRVLLVATVEEALDLGRSIPGSRVMGEVGGAPPAGFHFGNSPPTLARGDVGGRTLIHRTTAGTQGVLRVLSNRPPETRFRTDLETPYLRVSEGSPRGQLRGKPGAPMAGPGGLDVPLGQRVRPGIWAASMAVASATAKDIAGEEHVTFVCTGIGPEIEGDSDVACAEYLFYLRRGAIPPDSFANRIRHSSHGKKFTMVPGSPFAAEDLEAACLVDHCRFCMPVFLDPEGPALYARKPGPEDL